MQYGIKKHSTLGKISLVFALLVIILFVLSLALIFLMIGASNSFIVVIVYIFAFLSFIFSICAIVTGAVSYFGKYKDTFGLISFILGICFIVISPMAISATVYVYVSGIIAPEHNLLESASVTVSTYNEKYIKITLVKVGNNYNNGYTNFIIQVNNRIVENLSTVGSWTIGESITIGSSETNFQVNGGELESNEDYEVSVVINDTMVYFGEVRII